MTIYGENFSPISLEKIQADARAAKDKLERQIETGVFDDFDPANDDAHAGMSVEMVFAAKAAYAEEQAAAARKAEAEAWKNRDRAATDDTAPAKRSRKGTTDA